MAEGTKKAFSFMDLVDIKELREPNERRMGLMRQFIESSTALTVLEEVQRRELEALLSRHREEREAKIQEVYSRCSKGVRGHNPPVAG